MTGIIVHGVGGLYRVLPDDGPIVTCRARGSLRRAGLTPLVGDRVCVVQQQDDIPQTEDASPDTAAVITEILPRKNALLRPAMANLDIMFVVCAAKDPDPSLRFIDKMLCILEYQKIEPSLIVTKADLDAHRAEQLRVKYEKCGFSVFVTDCESLSADRDIAAYIASFEAETTAAFCGASGVGKSTLINRLFPGLALETGALSEKIARGRHTTRAVTLFPLSSLVSPDQDGTYKGFLADTPGFSMLDFERFDFFPPEELPYTFREFVPYIGQCRYTKCTHTVEEGCAVLRAAEEKRIPKSRHTSYTELYAALKGKGKEKKEKPK
ncbi:MAG: ribosome small subunit-dependent GTPase A [Eubacteriales bacterium]